MHHTPQRPFTHRFLSAVEQFPSRPALVDGTLIYSYEEVLSYVTGMVEKIDTEMPEQNFVAVADQNDVYTYASFIALNLLGKTYVPINPRMPEAHNVRIIEEAGIQVILSSAGFCCGQTPVLSNRVRSVSGARLSNLVVAESSAPAYVLFTSGSTGHPKGVPVQNKHLNAFFDFFSDQSRFSFQPEDRFLQVYETVFDVSVFSAFTPLFAGACLCLLPKKNFTYLEIPQQIEEKKITVVSMVPSALHYLQPYFSGFKFETLRYCFFSGDKLFQNLVSEWSACIPNAQIINCYGPTETTIVCTHYNWDKKNSSGESLNGVVPLGKPFPGMDYVLVNSELEDVPEGESGELCFSGNQVIDSYLHGESNEHFFERICDGKSKQFYKTGDRALISAEGNLLFVGRTDAQLKINGYRIEPAEIEAAISKLTGSSLVAVIAAPAKEGILALYAFLEGEGDEQELSVQLTAHLPAHSIPRRILFMNKMPMNSNGKIDRKKLLEKGLDLV